MTKDQILAEIKRLAVANGGVPPGMGEFKAHTGVRREDWLGIHWRSWGDAVREAGFAPNTPPPRIEETELLRRYALLIRELGHSPARVDLRLKKRRDQTFPSHTTFVNHFGSYPAIRTRAYAFCLDNADLTDVAELLAPSVEQESDPATPPVELRSQTGYVYLVQHGSRSEYKIGKTFNPLRREGEIRLQLPEKLKPIHYIETDDPTGVEEYWHRRFAVKRKEGEWFALDREDISAFKRWKRIA